MGNRIRHIGIQKLIAGNPFLSGEFLINQLACDLQADFRVSRVSLSADEPGVIDTRNWSTGGNDGPGPIGNEQGGPLVIDPFHRVQGQKP